MKMKKIHSLILIIVLSIVIFTACNSTTSNIFFTGMEKNPIDKKTNGESAELLISAAASLTDALEEIRQLYKAVQPETTITFSFGSSGALQTQIEEGAPVDIFMSAAEKQMDSLRQGGYMIEDSVKSLLINRIVMVTPKDSSLSLSSFEDLRMENLKKVAIGDPSNVPVGQYSEEIFLNLDLMDDIQEKLILANDVRTVVTWVERGEVDCGLVYESDALSSNSLSIVARPPEASHRQVTYPVGLVKDSKNLNIARDFLDFLTGDQASQVFKKYGFSIK